MSRSISRLNENEMNSLLEENESKGLNRKLVLKNEMIHQILHMMMLRSIDDIYKRLKSSERKKNKLYKQGRRKKNKIRN